MLTRMICLKRQDIAYLQFILEGYEGLFSVTTIDPSIALIQISSIPCCEPAIKEILHKLKEEIEFHELWPMEQKT